MAKVTIDGIEYDLSPGKNLLQAGLEVGLDIPYFCWHPALGSVGACRQCAVKQYRDENDERGMIVMSCMVPCSDGARFSIEDEEISQFRKTVTEWLMTNHPHDCPVCDEGGECHLQDMTVMTGHNYRTYRFTKRTYENQNLGPHINHEMNRCITCYRCVRFYDDYAGGKDLQAIGKHNHVYFGRHESGTLESEFSGNLVEVCPTGVFTDKTFKQHYLRKWDLQSAPSICQGCSVGCNILAGERSGKLRRVLNRYHGELNGYFICDRGRFGYEYVNAEDRLRLPLLRKDDQLSELNETALSDQLQEWIGPGKKLLGIGSPRASVESNYALRAMVGPDHFCNGMTRAESGLLNRILSIRKTHPAKNASLEDIEAADAVIVLGEDLINTAPRIALSIRQAVKNEPNKNLGAMRIPEWSDKAVELATYGQSGPFFSATPKATRLDDIVTRGYHGAPANIARLGYALAHALDSEAPAVPDLSEEESAFVDAAAEALRNAEKPVVISGTTLGDDKVLEAAANLALALHRAEKDSGLSYVVPETNSMGIALLGGNDLETAIESLPGQTPDAIVILENDLYHRLSDSAVDAFLGGDTPVILLDHSLQPTAEKADLRLPVGAFAEADGTLVNFEGRAQRFYQVYPAAGAVQESWRWIRDLLEFRDPSLAGKWKNLDDILLAIEAELPALQGIAGAAPLAEFRGIGGKVPRMSRRASGRTAINAHVEVSEDKPEDDPDSPLSFSMEGTADTPASALISRFWAPGWNSVSSLNKFQDEIGGHLRGGDPGVRLLPHPPAGDSPFYNHVPPPFESAPGSLLVLPLPHIFGSEEWSARCEGIRKRGPGPSVLLHPEDAAAANLSEGDLTKISFETIELTLPVEFNQSLRRGTAGLTPGLPGLKGLSLPASAKWSS